MAGLAPSSTPHVGTALGDRYELVSHIARGGMGDVYEGEDRLLQRRVAVKVFRAAGPADRTRFDAEVRILASLNHPGLVRVFDAGSLEDDAYVVLELVDGPCLADTLADRGPLAADDLARLGADLADALAYIHRHGVVHRDVTPRNVLCGPDGRPRLVDFGIVRLLDTPRITATSTTVGTAAFMAPEQLQGVDVTPAADVYALGLVLLELLTGRRAFDGTPQEAAAARLVRDPDTSGVPGAWRALLLEMTARDAAARPTALEVRDRLVTIATTGDVATGPLPVAGADGDERRPIAWDADATRPLAATDGGPDATRPLAAAGGATSVFTVPPAALVDDAPYAPPSRERRRARWALVAGVAAALLLVGVAVAASQSGSDDPSETTTIPSPSTTAAEVDDADTPPPTQAPTTAPPTTVTPETTVPEVIPADPVPDETPAPDGPAVDPPGLAPQAVEAPTPTAAP